MVHEWQRGDYTVSTDKARLDHILIHGFLTVSYWAVGRTLQEVVASIKNSVCFGVYKGEAQIGFARVITDFTTMAYLADVFILPAHRGKGLGKWLVESILVAPELQKNSFWLLLTQDAQWLYEQSGFRRFHSPDGVMVKRKK